MWGDVDGRAVDGEGGHRPDAQRPLVGAGHRRAAGDRVAGADQLVDLEVQGRHCVAQRRDHLLQVGGEVGPRRFLLADGAWSDDEWAGWLRATVENALLEP